MKRRVSLVFVVVVMALAVSLIGSACAPKPAKTVEKIYWTFSRPATPGEGSQIVCERDMKEVFLRHTDGRLVMEVKTGLHPLYETASAVRAGSVQAGEVWLMPEVAIMSFNYLADLLWTLDDADKVWDLFQKYVAPIVSEKHNMYLMAAAYDDAQLLWTRKPVDKLEDFKGLKVNCFGISEWVSFLKKVGAEPMLVAYEEISLSLERGILDATLTCSNGGYGGRYHEVTKVARNLGFGISTVCFMVNKPAFDALPEDLKPKVRAAFDEIERLCAIEVRKVSEYNLGKLKEAGYPPILEASPELKKQMEVVAREVREEMVRAADAKGEPGTALMQDLLKALGKK